MKNKFAAALLAFLCGAFGIHKFYLGETFAGILYLVFCWSLIPGILAFFDFIGLILMSDRNFDAKYNAYYLLGQQGGLQESAKDKAAILMELKKLYDSGVITAEEYEQKRRKYLDSL